MEVISRTYESNNLSHSLLLPLSPHSVELPLYPAPLHSFAFSEDWEIKAGKDKLAPRMSE